MKIRLHLVTFGVVLAAAGTALIPAERAPDTSVFARQNLVAWCIVPFDSAHRGPVERARMLKSLGITMLAYDWRDKDIPTFDEEVAALRENGIALQAFWLTSGPDPASDSGVRAVLDLLKRQKVKTEIWYMYRPPKGFDDLSQSGKVAQVSQAVKYLATEAQKLQSKVGLYNHGGWYGEPENELAVLKAVGMPNVGLVYNFHHGHEQISRFPEFFPKMQSHLLAVNINGMRKEGPMILTVGEGDQELEMLKLVRSSGYKGLIGILNHMEDRDAEVGLKANMAGLQKLLRAMGDEAALRSY